MKIKHTLKKIPFIFALNFRVKAKSVKRSYNSLRNYYEHEASLSKIEYNEIAISEFVKNRLIERGIRPPKLDEHLRIFYVGANYHQDFCGIVQGLQKLGQVFLFEGKPGNYGQVSTEGSDWLSKRTVRSQRLLDQVKKALESGPIHVLIGQMWARTIDPVALQKNRDMGIVVVNISMDDRHQFRGQKWKGNWTGAFGLLSSMDLAATAAPECRLWYLVEGCPAIYMPEASDPDIFHPFSDPKKYDVSFVGGKYGIREKIVKAIEKSGVQVECYGSGWPNGRIPTEEVPELFARSKIVLGVGTIGYCNDFYALKMRDFDGPMSGSLYLTHHNPDLECLFEIGKEIETYRNIDECVKKVHYYLEHPEEREAIAKAGRIRAEKEHTWEKRFEKIFKVLGIY